MTGLYPARTGITDFLRDEPAPGNRFLPLRLRTVAEHLAGSGYLSALVGKWHLTEDYSGRYRSRKGNQYAQGFDSVLLSEERYIGGGDMFFPWRFLPSVRSGRKREYLTERIAADSSRWIKRHACRPFFVHISNYAIHYRWQAKARLIDKYEQKKRSSPEFQHTRYNPVVAVTLGPRFDEQQTTSGKRLGGERRQASVGLVKEAANYLSFTHDHARRTVSWTLVSDGVDRSRAGEPEPLDALEGTVDLGAPGARLGIGVDGSTIGVYADQGTGWEFLFLLEVGGEVDLTDPQVRREWRFATGVSLSAGSQAVGRYQIRQG